MANLSFLQYLQGNMGAGAGFNSFAAGNKQYGAGAPNVGVSRKQGYVERDNRASARRNAVLRRMQSRNRGAFGSANAQRPIASNQGVGQ